MAGSKAKNDDRKSHASGTPALWRLIYALAASCALAGCAAAPEQHAMIGRHIAKEEACTEDLFDHPPADFDVADHMLISDPFGGYETGVEDADFAPNFEQQFRRIMSAHARFRAARPLQPNRLLVFINGGLADTDFNLERAREQMPCMMREGYFPIFLVWHAAGFDAYWDQVSRVRSGRQYHTPRVDTPLYFLSDIGEGIARAPATWLNQFRRFAGAEIAHFRSTFDKAPVVQSELLNLQYEGPEDTPAGLFGRGIRYELTSPFGLLAVPFTVSFGRTAWEDMIRRAHATIRRSDEFEPIYRDAAKMHRYPKGTGSFSMFMAELGNCISRNQSCLAEDRGVSLDEIELTIISHSIGAQITEDLVSLYDNLPYRNIVHLGSASSIRHFTETLEPVLEKQPDMRFYNLSLHPSADARQAMLYGLAPSGSMLEWIDDMFSRPPTPLDRVMGKWLNDAAAEFQFAPELHDRVVFRVFGFRPADPANGDPGDPVAHSDMVETRMEYWRPDFWSLPSSPSAKQSRSQ